KIVIRNLSGARRLEKKRLQSNRYACQPNRKRLWLTGLNVSQTSQIGRKQCAGWWKSVLLAQRSDKLTFSPLSIFSAIQESPTTLCQSAAALGWVAAERVPDRTLRFRSTGLPHPPTGHRT